MAETSDATPVATPSAPPQRDSIALWLLRTICLVALLISLYLAQLALSGKTVAGCGLADGIDCDRVLSSRWSYWLELPVSVPAASLWLTALMTSLFVTRAAPPRLRFVGWWMLVLLTAAAASVAVWFIGLQGLVLRHWCLYCLAVHLCGMVAFVVALRYGELSTGAKTGAVALGVALAALVPLGQSLFPPPAFYVLDVVPDASHANPLVVNWLEHTDPQRPIVLLGGSAQVDASRLPRIGPADAPQVVVAVIDYACFHCRDLHGELVKVQQEYDGALAVVLVPTPLSHKCNTLVTEENSTSPDACELARLALIVWEAQPEKFAAYDAWLFEPEDPRPVADARAKAAELIGAAELAKRSEDPIYERQLQRHIDLYAESPTRLLPQIIGRNAVLSAGVASTSELIEALEKEFGIKRP